MSSSAAIGSKFRYATALFHSIRLNSFTASVFFDCYWHCCFAIDLNVVIPNDGGRRRRAGGFGQTTKCPAHKP